MSYQPDIIPSSSKGQELQAAIQKELTSRGWSTEDDTVMAEYCLVMLGNRKTPESISTELSDLIGTDFEPSFVSWLFTELSVHYPDPNAVAATSTTISSPQLNNNGTSTGIRGAAQQQQQARRGSAGGTGNTAVFGQALSGVKREREEPEFRNNQRLKYDRAAQFEGVPAGPRNNNGGVIGGGARLGTNVINNNRNGSGDKSIFERIGNNAATASNGSFDMIQGTIDAVTRSGNQAQFNPQAQQQQAMDPRMLAQAQAHAMAQFQAFAAMQGQQMAFLNNNGGNNNAFGGGGPSYNPNFNGPGNFNGNNGGLGFPMAPPRQNQQHGQFQQPYQQQNQFNQQQQNHHQQQQQQKSFPPPPPPQSKPVLPLPTKPLEAEICKHGVDCIKPTCPFSHPSPVATKYSGLVLSSEACEKGLNCEDLDCSKSHVSASQKRAPVASTSNPSVPAYIIPRAPPVADPSSLPGAGEKICKFAAACTRKGCVFLHPWDIRDSGAAGGVVCRWGEACTRADCHYSHPTPRSNVYTKPKPAPYPTAYPTAYPTTYPSQTYIKPKSASAYSATFNNPNNPAIGAWPTEAKTHVSDRLKRFNGGANSEEGNGEVERIIPGESKNDNVKVEIDIAASSGDTKVQTVEEGKPVVA